MQNRESAAETLIRPPRVIALWIGVLTGPLVVAIEQELNFALVRWACENGAQWVLRLIDIIALVVTLIAAGIAWQCWSRAGRRDPDDAGGPPAVARFMALGGFILSLMFAAVIVAHGISMFLMGVCQ